MAGMANGKEACFDVWSDHAMEVDHDSFERAGRGQ